MKKILFIIALLFFLKPLFPVLEYALNYEYISKVLCENKDKPEMKCNGKCHLMKEMAKAAEDEKPISSDKKTVHTESEILFFQPLVSYDLGNEYWPTSKEPISHYSNLYHFCQLTSVFHPPTV